MVPSCVRLWSRGAAEVGVAEGLRLEVLGDEGTRGQASRRQGAGGSYPPRMHQRSNSVRLISLAKARDEESSRCRFCIPTERDAWHATIYVEQSS